MRETLTDRFYKEAEASFRKIAQETGLGLGINGTHTTLKHGPSPAVSLFGWCGAMSIAIIFGLPDAWRPICRGYVTWCAGPASQDVDPAHLPPGLAECVVTSPDDLMRTVRNSLSWLKSHTLEATQASFVRECLEPAASRGAS